MKTDAELDYLVNLTENTMREVAALGPYEWAGTESYTELTEALRLLRGAYDEYRHELAERLAKEWLELRRS